MCWKTAASRFYRWTDSGVWQAVLVELQKDADEHGLLDWSKHFVDGSSVRVHQHAAGVRGSTPENEALDRSRGGGTTKFHLRAEGNGKPLTLLLSAGQRHESTLLEPLMEKGGAHGVGTSNADPPRDAARSRRFSTGTDPGLRATSSRRAAASSSQHSPPSTLSATFIASGSGCSPAASPTSTSRPVMARAYTSLVPC